ncbi:TPA: hypothetical protein NDY80_001931 [Pseudomonas aeruginosa]|nr:hypothetical protein [Pseudomonas aeruginosa]HCD6680740.1 hypothetical protein [Pseudomonas aeruginosa]HCD6687722.1 hypothetical protein [Pseudomonas aeruginosa]HCD7189759.1 hypothetical protein [Pseudomonas aeruginosa]
MTKANECTCPSGDGSLRHPCPAHPAAEQAGGDERAGLRAAAKWHREQRNAFEAEAEMHRQRYENTNRPDSLTAEAEHHRRLWETASAMAANHLDYAAGFEEMARAALAQPSPAQAEKAEAERPEVVARVVHSNPVVLGQCGPLNANDELMTVAQHAASVARWAEMFNRVEQERDAALARVAELERKLRNEENAHTTTIEQRDNAEHWADQLAKAIAERFGVDIGEHSNLNCPWNEALVWMQQPPAQAQHSVPEGWKLVPIEPTQAQLSAGQTAWLADPMRRSTTLYRAMLAAAPQPVAEGE